MAYCSNCGHELRSGAKFCDNCGVSVIDTSDNTQRKTVYEGKLHKCPNCGETLGSFIRNCPSCGLELREINHDSAVLEFSRKLEAIEANREYESPKAAREAWKSGRISKTDEQKISLIQSFAVPNTKEDMLEFMILATSILEARVQKSIMSEGERALNDAWFSKARQIYEKAKHSYGVETDFYQIQDLYDKCIACAEKENKRIKKAEKSLARFFVFTLAFFIFTYAVLLPILHKRDNNKIESIKNEVTQALEDGEYKKALLIAESIDYKQLSGENARQWKITQELLKDEIIKKAEQNGVHLERATDEQVPSEVDYTDESDKKSTIETISENIKQGLDILRGNDGD